MLLSRRLLLFGSGCGLAAAVARAHADAAPESIVLKASKDGFNGVVPGPVIRARRGDEVKVRLVNGLSEPMALCWHGVRFANAMDGNAPSALVGSGASADYRFIVPDAGTFWYRAVPRARQEAGLYGALIVAEPAPPPVDQDHVLVFGSPPERGDGARRCTVNGADAVDIQVRANERLRLRFVNASAAQVMNARIENHRVLVMALDGEPAEPFASRDGALMLGPGNRADVFVDATLTPGSVAKVAFITEGSAVPPAVRLVYAGSAVRSAPLGEPAPLPANPLPERMNFSHALRVTLPAEDGGAGRGNPSRINPPPSRSRSAPTLFTAERGRTVVMALDNRDAGPRIIYLHGHHFRLLDRLDDGWKPYWLDTLPVAPRQTARIAFVADNPGRWRVESGTIDGAEAAQSWFEVK
jgi:FtsP/CotA-like multicopper oxidase with cupredoxin domain